MTARVSRADAPAGTQLPVREFAITRADLVRYAGASGDDNPIHWSDRQARSVGLPGVIAHGMFTMATAGRVLTDWLGDPGAVLEYATRFSAPVPVPDDDQGSTVVVSGRVSELREDGRAVVLLDARLEGTKVLSAARALVQLA